MGKIYNHMNEAKKELIKELFKDDEATERIINAAANNYKRPMGTSSKSRYPYYKRAYAERLKKWLDEMLENKCHKTLYYEEWCTEKTGIKELTLYHQINQSRNFLLDHMDPDKKYRDMFDLIIVKQEPGLGVTIRWRLGLDGSSEYKAVNIPMEPTIPRWKIETMEWLESNDSKPLLMSGLSLRESEIAELKDLLSPIDSIKFIVRSSEIKIIRMSL